MEDVQKTLDAAEEALLRADAVRLAAFHAVEKAREALSLKAAGVFVGMVANNICILKDSDIGDLSR